MMMEELILVNEKDEPQGKMEKLEVHKQGLLHRAFSVFLFNSKGELLLQQRANDKYHSAELWTNTCCSHPRYGELLEDAIDRRLMEEMGMECETQFAFKFIYMAEFENGLTEHEYDHVYFGLTDDIPIANSDEVQAWKYITLDALLADIAISPQEYTEWMKLCLPRVKMHIENSKLANN